MVLNQNLWIHDSMKRTFFIFLILAVSVVFLGVIIRNWLSRTTPITENTAPGIPGVSQAATVTYRTEAFVSGLSVPWSIAFTSHDRILVAERTGAVRIVDKGKLSDRPLYRFPDVFAQNEAGLLGITLDPAYSANRIVYAAYAYKDDRGIAVKVVRFIDGGNSIRDLEVLIDRIPGGIYHDGTRLRFGPDRMLYISTGEGGQKGRSQDLSSLSGKILRIEPDGSIPPDNPFGKSPVFASGLRNSQGLDFDPLTGNLWATDHGPSTFDGPPGGDELNLIKAGGNYGWPLVSHDRTAAGMTGPKAVYTPAVAPASLLFYRGSVLSRYTNDLFFGGLAGTGIYHVRLSADRQTVVSTEKLPFVDVGRIRDVVEGPDGYIYFSTSNQDGRGTPRPGDDKIYRIVPETP